MCGLAGIVTRDGIDARVLDALGSTLAHRGPDGASFLRWHQGAQLLAQPEAGGSAQDTVGLAHRRLSIIDLTPTGDQPMIDASGELALIYCFLFLLICVRGSGDLSLDRLIRRR